MCHSDRSAHGLRPTQGDEKRLGPASTLHGTVALSIVIPRACDFFDLFVFSALLAGCFSPPQSRHPERSAARVYRITDGLWRAVEGPRRCLLADTLPSFPATNYRPNQKSHKLRAYTDFLPHRSHRRPRMWFSLKRTTCS